jgi:23S rRNA (guanine745-N1)-methyltransferase
MVQTLPFGVSLLAEVVPYLRCPICGGDLAVGGSGLRCPRGHDFNRARQGYVDLTSAPLRHQGDGPEMVAARAEFFAAGHYGFISAGLAAAAAAATAAGVAPPGAGLVVDVGAGTGAHLAAVLDARPEALGLAVDVSRYALRRAARSHPRVAAVRADAWAGLPLRDASVGLLLDVFAPRHGAEFARVLRPDGLLLVVTPGPDHLTELVTALDLLRVDPSKEDRLAAGLAPWLRPVSSTGLRRRLSLDHAAVRALVGMGPSAWHVDAAALAARVAALPVPLEVTASVRIGGYSVGP